MVLGVEDARGVVRALEVGAEPASDIAALIAEALPGMGPEVIGDELWETLFSSGPLVENPGITLKLARLAQFSVQLEATDQLGMPRPANALGDIGAIEAP